MILEVNQSEEALEFAREAVEGRGYRRVALAPRSRDFQFVQNPPFPHSPTEIWPAPTRILESSALTPKTPKPFTLHSQPLPITPTP